MYFRANWISRELFAVLLICPTLFVNVFLPVFGSVTRSVKVEAGLLKLTLLNALKKLNTPKSTQARVVAVSLAGKNQERDRA